MYITRPGFLGGSAGKEPACNVGDLGSIPGLGKPPGEGKGYPLKYSGLCSSWCCKELDTTERRKKRKPHHFAGHLKLTQYRKSTIFPFLREKKDYAEFLIAVCTSIWLLNHISD